MFRLPSWQQERLPTWGVASFCYLLHKSLAAIVSCTVCTEKLMVGGFHVLKIEWL